ncbi:hypothetical protein GCM10009737_00040 [Nocardioides lentus]|uniref:Methyltransferase small domain-containing protein n=1 Tax=Nocardioides lentus TaxID=338077 RepID=A0ABN2NWG7_9ACTN
MSVPVTAPDTARAEEEPATVDFGGLVIEHGPDVLHPRDWTRLQSLWADELLDDAPEGPVLELCTGAGHIGLLLARLSGRALVAVDREAACCATATANAARNGLSDRVEVREAPFESALADDEVFALALADPPWVRSAQVSAFPEDPLGAIDGGLDGLDVARAAVAAVRGHLAPGGSLLVQLGDDRQADALAREADADGWQAAGRRHGERGLVLRLRHP